MWYKTQGEDIAVLLNVKDSEGNALPINSMVDYSVTFYLIANTGNVSKKILFKKTPSAGEYQAINHNNNGGELLCVIPRSLSEKLPVGQYNIQLVVKVNSNSNYENSQTVSIEKTAKAFTLNAKV